MNGIIPRSITSKRHSGQTTGTFKPFKTPRLLQGITAGAKSSGQRNTPKICTGRPHCSRASSGNSRRKFTFDDWSLRLHPISSRSVFIVPRGVCVVYESGVELPSDLSGILYVQYD